MFSGESAKLSAVCLCSFRVPLKCARQTRAASVSPWTFSNALDSSERLLKIFRRLKLSFSGLLPPYSVGKGVVFQAVRPPRTVRSFVRSNIVTTISHERLEQFWQNWQGVFTSPCADYLIRFCNLKDRSQVHSRPLRWRRHPRRRCGVKVYLLVFN